MHMDKNLADSYGKWGLYLVFIFTVSFILFFFTFLHFVCNVGILVGITQFTKMNFILI